MEGRREEEKARKDAERSGIDRQSNRPDPVLGKYGKCKGDIVGRPGPACSHSPPSPSPPPQARAGGPTQPGRRPSVCPSARPPASQGSSPESARARPLQAARWCRASGVPPPSDPYPGKGRGWGDGAWGPAPWGRAGLGRSRQAVSSLRPAPPPPRTRTGCAFWPASRRLPEAPRRGPRPGWTEW